MNPLLLVNHCRQINMDQKENKFYTRAPLINSGKCIAEVTATGNQYDIGKIGQGGWQLPATQNLTSGQVNQFVRRLAFFGLMGFFIIFFVNYFTIRNG